MELTPSNGEKIFRLPLQESEAAMFRYIIQVHMQSVDLKYKPTEGCSQYQNGSYTCWTQITKAIFNVSIWTAIVYYVYYRTIERRPSGVANGRFFRVTQNLEGLFSQYYTTVFKKHLE